MKELVIFIIVMTLSSFACGASITVDGKEVDYKVREGVQNLKLDKINLTIEVQLVDGRLPNKKELRAVSQRVLENHQPYKMNWVFFLLPKMESGAGAYATDHRAPKPEGVKISEYMLLGTPYQELLE